MFEQIECSEKIIFLEIQIIFCYGISYASDNI